MITQGLESDENTKYYSESNISNKGEYILSITW